MMNIMTFEGGYKATVAYDPEIEMFRGEFYGLNGGADFYAKDIEGLKREGAISLRVFLEGCAEKGIPPRAEALAVGRPDQGTSSYAGPPQ